MDAPTDPRPPRAGRRPSGLVLLLALLLATLGPRAAAQTEAAPPGLTVRVTDAATGEPLPQAKVLVDGRLAALTGTDGTARVDGLPAGAWLVEVSLIGHHPRRVMGRIGGDGTGVVDVALEVRPISLAELRAGAVPQVRTAPLRSFYARARTGGGEYITRAEIERINPLSVSDLFRVVPGMVVVSTAWGDAPVMEGGSSGSTARQRGGRARAAGGGNQVNNACRVLWFIDGTPIEAPANGMIGWEVDPREVEGIEIYRRVATAPAQFRRAQDACGIVLIWKRERIVGRGVVDAAPADSARGALQGSR